MYGSEDGIMLGWGFACLRGGNYETVGVPPDPPTGPGFPRMRGPRRTSWF